MAAPTAIRRRVPEPDAETRATGDDHDALRVWLRLLATTNLLTGRVRRLLRERFATTLPRFDLLAQLERAPEGLKMGELSQRLMVTGGSITGLTDQLQAEGLVTRSGDPHDRRALRVRLTAAGRRAFRAMASSHERWIVESLGVLGRDEIARLAELLGRVKAHVKAIEDSAP